MNQLCSYKVLANVNNRDDPHVNVHDASYKLMFAIAAYYYKSYVT